MDLHPLWKVLLWVPESLASGSNSLLQDLRCAVLSLHVAVPEDMCRVTLDHGGVQRGTHSKRVVFKIEVFIRFLYCKLIIFLFLINLCELQVVGKSGRALKANYRLIITDLPFPILPPTFLPYYTQEDVWVPVSRLIVDTHTFLPLSVKFITTLQPIPKRLADTHES